jgi:hypothetical protein
MYRLSVSPQKNKKMAATFVYKDQTHVVHFGHPDYEDYTQHRDAKRRRNYLTRSAGIRNGQGRLTKDDPLSANYWSRRVLWDSQEPFYGLGAVKKMSANAK